jgi:hypothetical protein
VNEKFICATSSIPSFKTSTVNELRFFLPTYPVGRVKSKTAKFGAVEILAAGVAEMQAQPECLSV